MPYVCRSTLDASWSQTNKVYYFDISGLNMFLNEKNFVKIMEEPAFACIYVDLTIQYLLLSLPDFKTPWKSRSVILKVKYFALLHQNSSWKKIV